MTQSEKRIWLIKALLKENPELNGMEIPSDTRQQQDLLRALMNIRPPKPISEEFLTIQDEYLGEEARLRGTTELSSLRPVENSIYLWQGDITTLKVDAIVNAANGALLGCFYPLHGCIDNIIHSRAGIQLRLYCHRLMTAQAHEEPTGQAKITPAFNLPSRFILHTVGPIISGTVSPKDRELLASCYRSCLRLAVENRCQSIAFCCISTGEFHFPHDLAAQTAVETVRSFLQEDQSGLKVLFNVYKDIDREIYETLLGVPKC